MVNGWNLRVWLSGWAWLECKGVVSGWCCKEVYRFPHIYLFSLLHLY